SDKVIDHLIKIRPLVIYKLDNKRFLKKISKIKNKKHLLHRYTLEISSLASNIKNRNYMQNYGHLRQYLNLMKNENLLNNMHYSTRMLKLSPFYVKYTGFDLINNEKYLNLAINSWSRFFEKRDKRRFFQGYGRNMMNTKDEDIILHPLAYTTDLKLLEKKSLWEKLLKEEPYAYVDIPLNLKDSFKAYEKKMKRTPQYKLVFGSR
ncbi:hypothetical protein OAT67_09565, partial [Bacteriovoracaceae bacterium]|nr:hypothetical protein [Bacteriovoracaceae bacterium]